MNDVGYHPDISSSRNYQSSITTRNPIFPEVDINNGESYLIQEISKKYILIPKLRSSFQDNGIQPVILNQSPDRLLPVQNIPVKEVKANTDENADWKSKYDILNILKNEENIPIKFNSKVESELQSNKGSLLNNPHQEPTNDYSKINTDGEVTPQTTFFNELPEKDTLQYDSNFHVEDNGIKTLRPNEISDIKSYDVNMAAGIGNDPKDNIDYNLEQLKLDYTNADETNVVVTRSPITERVNYESQPEIKFNATSTEMGFPPVGPVIETVTENAEIESGFGIEINPEMDGNVPQEQGPKDAVQTVELDQTTTPVIDVTETKSDLAQSSQEQSAINPEVGDTKYNSQYPEVQTITIPNELDEIGVQNQQNIETVAIDETNLGDVSGAIDDFNAEQANMFYSEPTDTIVTNIHSTEIPDQQETQDFDYYKAIEQQAYSTEINDEGLTEKYDPVYEQQYHNVDQELEHAQYAEDVAYQQQQQYEQQQQYQEQEHYQQQEQYQQQLYDQQYEQQSEPQGPQMPQDPHTQQDPQMPQNPQMLQEYAQSQEGINYQQYEQEYGVQELQQALDTEDGYAQQAQQQDQQNVVQYTEEAPTPVAQLGSTDNVQAAAITSDQVKG